MNTLIRTNLSIRASVCQTTENRNCQPNAAETTLLVILLTVILTGPVAVVEHLTRYSTIAVIRKTHRLNLKGLADANWLKMEKYFRCLSKMTKENKFLTENCNTVH